MKIWTFPILPVSSQLFHVPGAAFDGGYTSGGARVISPEPGGRSVLETELALGTKEWKSPLISWLMSKINGEVFRVRMSKTPQIARFNQSDYFGQTGVLWDNNQKWENDQEWLQELVLRTNAPSLEGSKTIQINCTGAMNIFSHGHVIGHSNYTYLIEDIVYYTNSAVITVVPPLRKAIANGDVVTSVPNFTGSISNGSEIRNAYERSNAGNIKLNKIVFQEVIL